MNADAISARPAARTGSRLRAAVAAAVLAIASPSAEGCAGHESRVRTSLEALDRGAPTEAIASLDEEMGVASSTELPKNLEGDNALLLLDRASIQMWLGRYAESSRDFGAADKAIEILDMRANAADDLGRYLFSDSVGRYRAPPYEKLMINTMNLASYLAQGKLEDAKVEARRLAVLQKYLEDQKEETTLLGLGSYLAGFAFEKAGSKDEALVFYEDALKYTSYASLRDPLASLTGGQTSQTRIGELIRGAAPLPPVSATGECDVVVLVNVGRVPEKEPRRIPIGLALTLVAGYISPDDNARANELAAKGLVTWINFPTLGRSRGAYSEPSLSVDGEARGVELAVDVAEEARAAYEKAEPAIVLSAITRLLARAVAGEVTELAASGGKRDGGAGIFGVLAGLATTATLTVLDTPDTRSWTTLPSHVAIARMRLSAGHHVIRISVRGILRDIPLDAKAGGYAVVTMSALR